ncbi:MAG: carboxypeptidase regulatory-like domain-containing protein, partial [Bacteroidota bacterium]
MKNLFLLLLLFLSSLEMKAGTTGILEGIIKDKETGNPIPGANVIVTQTRMGSVSGIDGKYIVYNIPVGTYSIRIQLIGYTSMLYENVEIHADLRTKLNISLTAS